MEEKFKKMQKCLKDQKNENKKFFNRLRKKTPKNLDDIVHELHDDAFDQIDCLSCANCCKTTSPIFTQKDIERIASHLKLKPFQFIEQYLQVDEDNDFVFQSTPCPFLGYDNYCNIYDVRPKACKEYPHTDQRKIRNVLNITEKNMEICPAVFDIITALKKKI